MLRSWTMVAVAIVTGVVLGDRARADTTTTVTVTTTTTTTTTTLLPHPFSPATAFCIHQAKLGRATCRASGGVRCFVPFGVAYSNCFAPGAGVRCATKCETTESTCLQKVPTTKKTCHKACATGLSNDVAACHRIAHGDFIWATGDAGCLTTAHANFTLCNQVCAGAATDCHTAQTFCIANCPNL